LPRGGVPVAFEVAKALAAPLDVILVRKIGAPDHSELGIGAVVDGANPQVVLNDEIISHVRPSASYLQEETDRQLGEIERRRRAYIGDRSPADVAGRTVILVDDGIATGGTARVAIKALKRAGATRVILAVPIAPTDTIRTLKAEADDVVCLETPRPFGAVGMFYVDFRQTTDQEVIEIMEASKLLTAAASTARM
jgi:putative phosphoribosyl transferase